VTTQAVIMDLIKTLSEHERMATLLITHDLALAAETCDRIVIMHAGHVVETAPTEALFQSPRFPICGLNYRPAGLPLAASDTNDHAMTSHCPSRRWARIIMLPVGIPYDTTFDGTPSAQALCRCRGSIACPPCLAPPVVAPRRLSTIVPRSMAAHS
jgi:hypothetical protein